MTLRLERDSLGQLRLAGQDGKPPVVIEPVRAFPLTAPHEGIALIDEQGRELAWIDDMRQLPDTTRDLLAEELDGREFMPAILRIIDTSADAMPCTWTVMTDRGKTRFVVKGEESLRRLGPGGLLVQDSHGITYRIPDRTALDRHSRRILDDLL
jgi:hypothetical protein